MCVETMMWFIGMVGANVIANVLQSFVTNQHRETLKMYMVDVIENAVHSAIYEFSRVQIIIEQWIEYIKPFVAWIFDYEYIRVFHLSERNEIFMVESITNINRSPDVVQSGSNCLVATHVSFKNFKRNCKTMWLNPNTRCNFNTLETCNHKFIMMELIDVNNAHHMVFLENEDFNFNVVGNRLTGDFFRFYTSHIHNNGADMSTFRVSLLDSNMNSVEFTQDDVLILSLDGYSVDRASGNEKEEKEESENTEDGNVEEDGNEVEEDFVMDE